VHLWTDGASRGNPGPASVGVMLRDPSGVELGTLSEALGRFTNNHAEYEAVRRGLLAALQLGATAAEVHADSELIIRQLTGVYRVKSAELRPLFDAAKVLEARFADGVRYRHVPREQNREADALANEALDRG
jgi:ribonuclease HI